MRGKPFEPKAAHSTSRNIPAYAGKSVAPRGQAHRRRNIPAYAGKTWRGRCSCHCRTEHPRVCGENADDKILAALEGGTSPRMRGKPAEKVTVQELKRNIPAYAGKTRTNPTVRQNSLEHPRVCGENHHSPVPSVLPPGTSPRMRGKRTGPRTITNHLRNIPAYAGKTTTWMAFPERSPEHPRVCGENSERDIQDSGKAGTSPRMRGKQQQTSPNGHCSGNIPAYAGKT